MCLVDQELRFLLSPLPIKVQSIAVESVQLLAVVNNLARKGSLGRVNMGFCCLLCACLLLFYFGLLHSFSPAPVESTGALERSPVPKSVESTGVESR